MGNHSVKRPARLPAALRIQRALALLAHCWARVSAGVAHETELALLVRQANKATDQLARALAHMSSKCQDRFREEQARFAGPPR